MRFLGLLEMLVFEYKSQCFFFLLATELAHGLEATAILKFIISRGNKGVLLQDIAQYMEVNHLDSRSASRYLLLWKLVNTITE